MFILKARAQESGSMERYLDNHKMGTTMDNQYYPLYTQERVVRENITDEVFLYKNYKKGEFYYTYSKYDSFFNYFNFKLLPVRFVFKTNAVSHIIYISKGYIRATDGSPLVMIGINKYFSYHYKNDEYTENRDNVKSNYYGRFKVFVASEFMTNPIYKNVWKKFNTECMNVLYNVGIPVEITTPDAITKHFFNNGFNPKFDSITEMEQHLSTVVPMIMRADVKYIAPHKAPNKFTIDRAFRENRINRGMWHETVEEEVQEIEETLGMRRRRRAAERRMAEEVTPVIPQEEWTNVSVNYDNNNVGTTTDYILTTTDTNPTYIAGVDPISTDEPTIIQGSGNTYENVRLEGDVQFHGNNNIIRNSTITGGGRIELTPEPEVEDPDVVHVTPRIDLVDDTVEVDVRPVLGEDLVSDGDFAWTEHGADERTEPLHEVTGVPAEQQGAVDDAIRDAAAQQESDLANLDLDAETQALEAEARAMFGDDYDQEVNTNDENTE